MASAKFPIPAICISPSLPDSPSQFEAPSLDVSSEEDGYRARYLAPSPQSPRFARQLSPLRPVDAPVTGKGLERERFEALLTASRERNAAVGRKKAVDLRKEIALKAHKTKQVERRALFLSKVLAPPSPTATLLAKTPPESPAIFHYSLPSPGYLVSPLAAFDADDASLLHYREPWVEQVDFRLLEPLRTKQINKGSTIRAANDLQRVNPMPSLDQITARLSSCGQVTPKAEVAGAPRPTRELPAFLQSLSRRDSSQRNTLMQVTSERSAFESNASLPVGVGRLRMPVRTQPVTSLQITTTVVPRTQSSSPSELSERNVNQIASNSRARRSKDMLSTLRRRTTMMHSAHGLNGHDQEGLDADRLKRRISAPAELQMRERSGFEHPVLSLPGGF